MDKIELKACMYDMLHGYIKDYAIGDIKIVFAENEEDFYDSAIMVMKRDLKSTYKFADYNVDFFDYDRMVEDITECVASHD